MLIEIESIDDRLRILLLFLFGDSRRVQEIRPEFWHAVELACRRIVRHMNRMIEIRRP
jgi:hypothetical protein